MLLNLGRRIAVGAASAALATGTLAGGLAASAGTHDAAGSTQPARLATAAVAPLTPSQLTYMTKGWGDPQTEAGIIASVPSGWTQTRLALWESKFTSANKLWNVRFNGRLSGTQSLNAAADAKLAALRATLGMRLISRTYGESTGYEGMPLRHVTIVYSYTDGARGTRLVVNRWINIYEGSGTDTEVSTGGRPQDRAGLTAVTAQATRTYAELP
jgi:hypothetical protein